MNKKIIAVLGATGAQGGGLVRAILADPSGAFAVRALTRDPASDKGRALAALGAEVVAADVDDEASLLRAFEGAHGVFAVTFFWQHMSPAKELAEAKALARAAKAARVQHVVWSSLEDTRQWVPLQDDRMPTLQEKYKVPHFDAKGEADGIFLGSGVPTTVLRTSFYWENFIYFGLGPKPGADGKLTVTLPMDDKKLPGIAAEDIGKCALAIFAAGSTYHGQTVGISGEQLTGAQLAEQMGKALGKPIVYQSVPPEVFRSFGFPGADDMGNMFQVKRDFEAQYCANRRPEFARQLNPELQSFGDWLQRHKDQIPLT